jgi:RND family efflux transporter MFP subunit
MTMFRWVWIPAAFLLLAGCNNAVPPPAPPKAPVVEVGSPVVQSVIDYEVFTGRTEAAERVDIRARVTGYLEKAYVTDGAMVKEDELLYRIDPRPYAAEVNKSEAAVAQAKAHLARIERDYMRAQPLVNRGTISREEFEKIVGDRDEAKAAVGVAESGLELARLNLTFTEVRAPFAGRVSRRMVDPGSLVKADETILTNLACLEPMHVYFDVDERTLLRQLLDAGKLETAAAEKIPISVGLSDEEGFPHVGIVNFVDNRVDPNTGTMWMRGEFVGPKRTIKPGIFSRVRFPLGKAYTAVLIAEQAMGTDQGQKFLYVVGKDNKVQFRKVAVGRLHDGLRVILDGLKPDETVVISGLQRVRPGAEITPKPVDMLRAVRKMRSNNEDSPAWPATAAAAKPAEGPTSARRTESGQ